MLLDRDVDAVSAGLTSLRLVFTQPGVMLFWGALISVVIGAAMLPWFAGLIVVGPVVVADDPVAVVALDLQVGTHLALGRTTEEDPLAFVDVDPLLAAFAKRRGLSVPGHGLTAPPGSRSGP